MAIEPLEIAEYNEIFLVEYAELRGVLMEFVGWRKTRNTGKGRVDRAEMEPNRVFGCMSLPSLALPSDRGVEGIGKRAEWIGCGAGPASC